MSGKNNVKILRVIAVCSYLGTLLVMYHQIGKHFLIMSECFYFFIHLLYMKFLLYGQLIRVIITVNVFYNIINIYH